MKITRRKVLGILLFCSVGTWLVLTGLERSYQRQEEQNYSLIDEGLYMGGRVKEPPPGTKAVLNLCESADPYHAEAHKWEPIRDAEPAPNLDWLRQMVEFVDTRRQAGLTVFVHCRNGVSRSGMVVTAYEMSRNHWTLEQALAFVRSRRPITRPNPAFMQRLLEWEQVLRERPAPRGQAGSPWGR